MLFIEAKDIVEGLFRRLFVQFCSAIVNCIKAESNSHNYLSAVLFLVHPLDSCSQMALLRKKMGFSFLPNGSNDHKIFEAHFLDYD